MKNCSMYTKSSIRNGYTNLGRFVYVIPLFFRVNQQKLVLVFNASFPVKSNESGIIQEAITQRIVAVEIKAYLLSNFTPGTLQFT